MNVEFRHAALSRRARWRPGLGGIANRIPVFGVCANETFVEPTLGNQDMKYRVEKRDVGARFDREMEMGRLGRGSAARIHYYDADTFAGGPALDVLPEHRMALGHVRSDNKEAFGVIDI